MRTILAIVGYILFSCTAALADAKDDMMAADRAFSELSVKEGARTLPD